MKVEISDLANTISNYLKPYSKEDKINFEGLNKFISEKINLPVPEKYLINYLHEKGYYHIELESNKPISNKRQTTITSTNSKEVKESPKKTINDLDDDFDFDPNEFLDSNKETIQKMVIPTKSFEDNSWLIEQYQKSMDDNLLFEIVKKNIGLVEKIANKYVNHLRHDLDYDDLVSVGKFGLMKGIKRFKPEKGFQFSTYATHWIRQSISRAIMDEGTTIRVPVHMHEQIMKLIRTENESVKVNNELDIGWVCQTLEITKKKYFELKQIDQNILGLSSLHSLISNEGDDSQLIEFIEYNPFNIIGAEIDQFIDPYELVEFHDLQDKLNEVIDSFTDREQQVIRLRFGFENGKTNTLEEVGKVFGVTRERIRQIEAKTIRKFRARLRNRKLKKEDLRIESLIS
jgi:RNA polymerase primary sigma factor